MKKLLLSAAAVCLGLFSSAQIITYVESPASLEGNLSFTITAAPDWGTPDMLITSNAVTDTLALAFDGTGDSTLCDPSGVVTNVAGKIAMFYRGGCQFGTKALAAQNAGAVACVIVNNSGAPVGMGAGADGALVTIPMVMISTSDGANLWNAVAGGTSVVMFIGNKTGLFGNDLGMTKADVMLPPQTGKPTQLAMDGTEFNSQIGAWVRNFGFNDASSVVLNAEATSGGSPVYTENSGATPINLPSGDSTFIILPDLALASYSGYYDLAYTVTSDSSDQFVGDDGFSTNFIVSNFVSNAFIDQTSGTPDQRQFFRLNSGDPFSTCIQFRDANASRVKVEGIWGAASTAADDSLTGKILNAEVWKWDDQFTDLNDTANLATNNINLVGDGEYIYTTNQQNELVYVPLFTELALEDNERYIFCVTSIDGSVFLGHDGALDYNQNVNNMNASSPQPAGMILDKGATGGWFTLGFGTDVTAGVAAQMADNDVSIVEQEELSAAPAYPNPAVDLVTIPLSNNNAVGDIQIFDINGRLVSTQPVQFNGNSLLVSVAEMSNGAYTFRLADANGSVQTFNVVVSR